MMDRIDELLAGIEAQAGAAVAAEDDSLTEDRCRAEFARVGLLDRVRTAMWARFEVHGIGDVAGEIAHVGADCVLLRADDGDWIIRHAAIQGVHGLPLASRPAGSVDSRLGFAAQIRAWTPERSVVRVSRLFAGHITGTLDRVGVDHLDIAEHDPGEPRRNHLVRRVMSVPFGAISAVRRQ